jgi:hypothetical protein
MSTTGQVTFRTKSPYQKDGCINQSAEYNCPNKSTLEAVYKNASIRCCTDKKCKQKAAEIAKKFGR